PERAQSELLLQITLGNPVQATKGYPASEVEKIYARALELCRQVGEVPQLSSALWGLWIFYLGRAELQTAREVAERPLSLAQRQQDPALLLEAYRTLGVTVFWLGELPSARAHLEQSIALYDLHQHRSHAFLYGHDPAVHCLSYMPLALWLLGYPDQALKKS